MYAQQRYIWCYVFEESGKHRERSRSKRRGNKNMEWNANSRAHIVSDALEFMSGSRIRVDQLQITLYTRMFSMHPEAAVLHVRERQTPAEEGKYRNLHDKRIKHQIFAQNTTAAASVLRKYLLALCCHFIFRLPKLYVVFSDFRSGDGIAARMRRNWNGILDSQKQKHFTNYNLW